MLESRLQLHDLGVESFSSALSLRYIWMFGPHVLSNSKSERLPTLI